MKDLEKKYEKEITYDLPIEYKDLSIYPVRIEDYLEFYLYIGCFFLEKNSIPDVRIIQMTYLEYMYDLAISGGLPYIAMFVNLLALCLKKEKDCIKLEYSKKKPIFKVGDTSYDGSDFEEIKNIICLQNSIILPDESIQKEIRDKFDEARELRKKLSGSDKQGSLEDLIISIVISTGLTFDDVKKFTIRKFNKALRRLDHKIHYEIYLSASMSGLVEFKDKSFIKHWLVSLDEDDPNRDVKASYESIKSKINFEDKKN